MLAKPVNEDFTEEKKAARLEKLWGQKESLLALKAMLDGMEDEEATVNMTDAEAKVMKTKDEEAYQATTTRTQWTAKWVW